MHTLWRLLGPRRRKTQEDIAGRAAEVVVHVLFDIGIDRFLDGTMLLDRRFRPHFYAVPPRDCSAILASIALRDLAEARVFGSCFADCASDAAMLARHTRLLVDGLMRELRARSPALRALPSSRPVRAIAA